MDAAGSSCTEKHWKRRRGFSDGTSAVIRPRRLRFHWRQIVTLPHSLPSHSIRSDPTPFVFSTTRSLCSVVRHALCRADRSRMLQPRSECYRFVLSDIFRSMTRRTISRRERVERGFLSAGRRRTTRVETRIKSRRCDVWTTHTDTHQRDDRK